MKNGKHMKKASLKKGKFKKSIFVIPFITIAIILLFNSLNFFSQKKSQTIEVNKNTTENAIEITSTLEEISNIPETIEPHEDENLKILIRNIQAENNLTEDNFAFFYYNIDKQEYYFYNENTFFTAASTVKVPVAMYYYDEINNNNLTLESKLLYTNACYEAGGGSTASTYSVGESIPLNFLLRQSIVNSDNTAVNILIRNLGWAQYRYDIAKYTDEELPQDFYENNLISANYAYDVINYLYENMNSYSELIEYMKQSSMGQYLKKYIGDYEVAHKYGSYNGYVHDYGIVFGENTYLIGIFTKNVINSDELIAQISLDILNYTLELEQKGHD